MVSAEYNSNAKLGYTHCFCDKNIVDYINYKFPLSDNKKICYDWFTNITILKIIPLLVVMSIIVVNIVV